MDAVLVDVLEARAAGRITPADATSAMKLASALGMRKEALNLPPAVVSALGTLKPSAATADAIRHGLIASAATGTAGLGIHGLVSGARAVNEKFSHKRDLEKILETFPRLRDYPQNEIDLAYNSIRHMNPHIAKDPLAGGSLLAQVLRQRDSLDPKTLRMDQDLAGNLLRLRPEERHVGEEILREGVQAGMTMGFQEAAKVREQARTEAFQTQKARADEAFKRQMFGDEKALKEQMQEREFGHQRGESDKDRVFRASQQNEQAAARQKEFGAKFRQDYLNRKAQGKENAQERAARERLEILKLRFAKREAEKREDAADKRIFAQAILRSAVNEEYKDPLSGQMIPPSIGDVLHLYPNLHGYMP